MIAKCRGWVTITKNGFIQSRPFVWLRLRKPSKKESNGVRTVPCTLYVHDELDEAYDQRKR